MDLRADVRILGMYRWGNRPTVVAPGRVLVQAAFFILSSFGVLGLGAHRTKTSTGVSCASRHRDCILLQDRIGPQPAVMWIEQHYMRTVVEPTVGHQLVDIGLAHAPFGIVDPRNALPLRVDDEGDSAALPDDEVGTRPEPSRVAFEEAVAVPALALTLSGSCPRACGLAVAPRNSSKRTFISNRRAWPSMAPGARLLVAVTQKEARERQ